MNEIKCRTCKARNNYEADKIYEDGHLVEYNIYCAACRRLLATWAYGDTTDEQDIPEDDD